MASVKVDNERKTNRIAAELSNEISRKIIFSIISQSKSGIEITQDTKLSQSTVYQKLTILKELSLVKTQKKITEIGRPTEFFKSSISKATIIIENEHPQLIMKRN